MAEEEKKAALLDSTILQRRKGLDEESMLRITLLKAAHKHMKKIMEEEDYVPAIGVSIGGYNVNDRSSFGMYNPESERWLSIGNFTDDNEFQRKLLPHHVIFKPGTVDECYVKLLNYRKELAIVRKKHIQNVQKQLLRLDKEATLRENLHQFLKSKRHRQFEKEENK